MTALAVPVAHFAFVSDLQAIAKYRPLGRGPVWFDCWGLVLAVARFLNDPVPFDPIETAQSPVAMANLFARHFVQSDWVPCGAETGAVAFFGSEGRVRAVHAGIVICGGVLDISKGCGVRHRPITDFQPSLCEFAKWHAF